MNRIEPPHALDLDTGRQPPLEAGPGRPESSVLNAFTVDVEDYYHVQAFAATVGRSDWDQYESRVVDNTRRMLKLLERHDVRGTFFILGWVADRFPQLVRDIHTAGHEIGCHSFWHRIIYEMTPEEFREDLLLASKAIEEVTGERITAFRAPSFSITERSLWALEILAEEGYRYDSSIFAVHHDFYGIPHAPRFPYVIETGAGDICQFPPSVYRTWRFNLPVAGGGYFRLYPRRLSFYWLSALNAQHGNPFMFYIHPWEIDPDQPRLPASLRSRFRQYQNLGSTESKLDDLLKRFRFGPLSEVLARQTDPLPRVPLSNLAASKPAPAA